MPGKYNADGLSSYRLDDATPGGFLGDQAHRPACAPLGGRSTNHRNQRRLLCTVELGRWLRPRVVLECLLKVTVAVALADTRNLARVPAHGDGCRPDAMPLVEEEQDADAPPGSGAQRGAATLHRQQLRPILGSQSQSGESSAALHPPL